MASSSPAHEKEIVDEVYGFILCYNDGSVERPTFPGGLLPASPEFVKGVASKDVILDSHTGIWARIFLPENLTTSKKKGPIVLHFHGGGLCSGSAAAAAFHNFCSRMAVKSESIWVSVDYRLAPEHRLPAAYDDAFASFSWLHSQASQQDATTDPWLHDYADFSNCFFAGESSGGAIVHYLMMQVIQKDWNHIQVRGSLIIHAAFLIDDAPNFKQTPNEKFERRPNTYRRLSLPIGAELDHPLLNPLHPQAPSVQGITLPPSIVAVADEDKLHYAAVHYVEALKKHGQKLELYITKGKGHCFYLLEPRSEEAVLLLHHLVDFIRNYSVPSQSPSSL